MIFSIYVVVFFFFKHKTAYEMRISDWSSDVCASDLWRGLEFFPRPGHPTRQVAWGPRPAPPRASQKTGGPAILRVRYGPPGAALARLRSPDRQPGRDGRGRPQQGDRSWHSTAPDRTCTRLNSSHSCATRMPNCACNNYQSTLTSSPLLLI